MKRITISGGEFLISKPGIDVDVATEDQLLMGAGRYPMQIFMTGVLYFPSGVSQQTVFYSKVLPYLPLVLFQSSTGTEATLPFGIADRYTNIECTPFLDRALFTRGSNDTRYVKYVIFLAEGGNPTSVFPNQFISYSANATTGLFTSESGHDWSRRTLPFPGLIGNVAKSPNGMFAISDRTGRIVSSPDARGFTERVSNAGSTQVTLRWAIDRFIGVVAANGSADSFVVSADGLTWVRRYTPFPSGGMVAMDWSGSEYIAVGSGAAYRSEDGVNWTAVSTAVGTPIAVRYLGDRWICVGASSVSISNDGGLSWTGYSPGITGITSMKYVGGRYFVMSATRFSSSANGASWSAPSLNASTRPQANSIAYGNGVWVVGCGIQSSRQGRVAFSSNGTSWSETNLNWDAGAGTSAGSAVLHMTFAAGRFLGGSQGGFFVCTSTNGSSWSLIPMISGVNNGATTGVVFNDVTNTWAVVGSLGRAAVSTNGGTSWVQSTTDYTSSDTVTGLSYG